MIRKRWKQVRQYLLHYKFWKPIWKSSLIMVPRNRLTGFLWKMVDNKCLTCGGLDIEERVKRK